MSIQLVFYGGFFVSLPGAGNRRKVLVYLCRPARVQVTDSMGKHDAGWEKKLSDQNSIDFVSKGSLTPNKLPMRHLSDLLPVNYNGFRKVVGFTGGAVSGDGEGSLPQEDYQLHASAKGSNDVEIKLKAFKKVCDISHSKYDADYRKGIVQRFCEEDVRWWKKGYHVMVELDYNRLQLRLGGLAPPQDLKDGLQITFRVADDSVIPHFPLNNPHVLEQPPTF